MLTLLPLGSAYPPGGPGDKNDGENKPEHVAENDDLYHVQVRPAHTVDRGQTGRQTSGDSQMGGGRCQPAHHEVRDCVEMKLPDSIRDLSIISMSLAVFSCKDPNRRLKLILKHLQL